MKLRDKITSAMIRHFPIPLDKRDDNGFLDRQEGVNEHEKQI